VDEEDLLFCEGEEGSPDGGGLDPCELVNDGQIALDEDEGPGISVF